MKKVFAFTLAAAALLALASCNKEKKQPIVYETPVYESLAIKYDVSTDLLDNPLNVDRQLSLFELTENGNFIILDKDGAHTGQIGNLDVIKDKNPDEDREIVCPGWGRVAVHPVTKADANTILTLYPDSGAEIVVSANVVNPSESVNKQFLRKLARKWAVTYTTISITGGDLGDKLSAGLNWNGCDLAKIKEDLEKKAGKTFDMGNVKGYVVDYLEVTASGTFIVKFKNGESIAANIDFATPSADKATFEYEVSGHQDGIAIFNGKANGEINFDKYGNCEMKISANVDLSNDAYKGSVLFKVKKI